MCDPLYNRAPFGVESCALWRNCWKWHFWAYCGQCGCTAPLPLGMMPMKLIEHIGSEKLRGGYYTGENVVSWCIQRVLRLTGPVERLTWLEPSAGDGAFIRGLGRFQQGGVLPRSRIEAVELLAEEAGKCENTLRSTRLSGTVINESFFAWARNQQARFDAVVGNPPYVRYQYVKPRDRLLAEELMARLGIDLKGVSNLWIPFAIVSMYLLKPGGAFALVLPSELFSTVSGGQFRATLIRDFAALRVDLFPRDTFPDILQDVVVVSGMRARRLPDRRSVTFCEHRPHGAVEWKHTLESQPESWLRYLLTQDEVWAFHEASRLPDLYRLGDLTKIEVSIVTGANLFFTVDDDTLRRHRLEPWARPLVARTSDCPGLVFTEADHARARQSGSRTWLLDFSEEKPDPINHGRVREYLALGERQGLPSRFKCRIRTPWYRVPQIRSGRLMMSKRAHHYHRLILNDAGVFTTDTIYRGEMLGLFSQMTEDLVAGFHNTLTLLSSEIEGRTYGGGVLELVPSEVARLRVPLVRLRHLLPRLDALSRASGGQRDTTDAVLNATDEELAKRMPGYAELLSTLRSARMRLHNRRMDVTHSAADERDD